MAKKMNILQKVKVLWDICKGYRKRFFFVFFISLVSSVLTSFGITTISPILDILLNNQLPTDDSFLSHVSRYMVRLFPENTIVSLIITFIILITIMGVSILITNWRKYHLISTISNSWRGKIFRRYLNSEFSYFFLQKQGTLYHNTLGIPSNSSQTLRYLIDLGISSISAVSFLVFLFLISWQLTAVSIAVGFIITVIPLKFVNKKAKQLGKKKITASQDLSQICTQALSGFRQILLYNQVDEEIDSFQKQSWKESKIIIKNSVLRTTPRAVRDFALFLMIGLGIASVKVIDLDISNYIPLLATYGVIAMKCFPLVAEIISNIIALSEKAPSIKLVNTLINDKSHSREDDKKGKVFSSLKKDIIVQDLTFHYGNEMKPVFNNLNLVFPKGQMTAVIGPSGIGKSTLVDLMSGLQNSYTGRILYNDVELREYSRYSLWQNISYVSQDPFIFNRSIRENITLNRTDLSQNDIEKAIEVSGCRSFLDEMDTGLETVIGERGMRLSGGQRQRISIARAVLKNPDIYFFDEATSALDNETEKFIQRSIEEISRKSTVIVIAHRLTTIENASVVHDLGQLMAKETKKQ